MQPIQTKISPSYRRLSQAFAALRRGESILIRGSNNRAALMRAAEFSDYPDTQMEEIAQSGTLLCMRRQHIEAFIEFCRQPPPKWIGTKNCARFIKQGGFHKANEDWRPFVVRSPKCFMIGASKLPS